MIKKSKTKTAYQIRKAKLWKKATLSNNKKLIEDSKTIPIRKL